MIEDLQAIYEEFKTNILSKYKDKNIDYVVNDILKGYDNLNKHIAIARTNNKPEDKSVFIYMEDWNEIEKQYNKNTIYNIVMNIQTSKNIFNSMILSNISTWRYTKTVYNFNAEIQEQLLKSDFKGDLPTELFERLPEYCVCIKLAQPITLPLMAYQEGIDHIFISLNKVMEKKSLIITTYSSVDCSWGNAFIELKNTISMFSEEKEKILKNMFNKKDVDTVKKSFEQTIRKIMPYLLYIISDKPDIQDINNKEYKIVNIQEIHKKGEVRLFPANKVTEWYVGNNIAEKIKQYYQSVNNGGTVRPHVRRGHWHTYWTGNRAGKQKHVIHWLFPILVNEDKLRKI